MADQGLCRGRCHIHAYENYKLAKHLVQKLNKHRRPKQDKFLLQEYYDGVKEGRKRWSLQRRGPSRVQGTRSHKCWACSLVSNRRPRRRWHGRLSGHSFYVCQVDPWYRLIREVPFFTEVHMNVKVTTTQQSAAKHVTSVPEHTSTASGESTEHNPLPADTQEREVPVISGWRNRDRRSQLQSKSPESATGETRQSSVDSVQGEALGGCKRERNRHRRRSKRTSLTGAATEGPTGRSTQQVDSLQAQALDGHARKRTRRQNKSKRAHGAIQDAPRDEKETNIEEDDPAIISAQKQAR